MKIFLDTEFMEDGKTIDLLSLAMVDEHGQEFYAVKTDAWTPKANDWVKENVLPRIDDTSFLSPDTSVIHGDGTILKRAILEWLGLDPATNQTSKLQFWGYYADYDWVAICQLFGSMMSLPKEFPKYCMDLKQFSVMLGDVRLLDQKHEHHALVDARWIRENYSYLRNIYRHCAAI